MNYKFVDLSGYGNTGKSAVICMLREFKGYNVPHHSFEFSLLRMPGGLIDLEFAYTGNWSPSRLTAAIKRFERLADIAGYNPNRANILGRLLCTGLRYDMYFDGRFSDITDKYIERLIAMRYSSMTGWGFLTMPRWRFQLGKALSKFGTRALLREDIFVRHQDPEHFYHATRDYLNDLFATRAEEDTKTFALYNACEPFDPLPSLNLFHSCKAIVVDRDPRDLYLSTLAPDQFQGKDHMDFSASHDLKKYVARYRQLREQTKKNSLMSPNVLHVQFEDLILHYDGERKKIINFLGETEDIHIEPRTHFDPDVSIKGVGMWNSTKLQEEIKFIGDELEEYCYQRD
jgi:Sulfotransferase domain